MKTRAELYSLITTDINTNSNGEITAAKVRNILDETVDSYVHKDDKDVASGVVGISAGNLIILPNGRGFISNNVTPNQIAYFDNSGNLLTLSVSTYPSLTELSRVKGLTSPVQTQLDSKVNREPNVQTVVSSATVTATSTNDLVNVTALAVGTTIANPTGTFFNGQIVSFRIKDNATPQTIAYGAKFKASGSALPTTTTANKRLTISCEYDSVADDFITVTSLEQ